MAALPQKKVGILGGGQLARMLALAAHPLGLEPHIYCENANDPAAQVVAHVHLGKLSDEKRLREFFSQVELVTFESEFVDTHLIEKLCGSCTVLPAPAVIGRIQDRLTQKEMLEEFKVPTLPWLQLTAKEFVDASLPYPDLVVKKRRFGYDGNGTFIFSSTQLASNSTRQLPEDANGYIAEPKLKFKRELALLAARSRRGDVVFFPLVEHKAQDSRCLWVKGPVNHPKLSTLKKSLTRMLRATNYVGILGVELFDTGKELWVNELAPRVHNTGHYSQDALNNSQFQMHWLCLLGAKISSPVALAKGFAMYNLLGSSDNLPSWNLAFDGKIHWPEVHLHWYGKSENRVGRKMGHLNALDKSPELALSKLKRARNFFKV